MAIRSRRAEGVKPEAAPVQPLFNPEEGFSFAREEATEPTEGTKASTAFVVGT